MKLATFNVENMFDRAKALNNKDWSAGKPALEAHRELNALFEKTTYTEANKRRMLELLAANGLIKSDVGPFLLLRKIRGDFVKKPRSGQPQIVAAGRASWIGWVELRSEPVNEIATRNTARVIAEVNADVIAVIEAEDRTTLKLFNKQLIGQAGIPPYDHVMLVDGNDDRGIDVGLLSRKNYPICSIRSHVHDSDATGEIFSRDCVEYEIGLPDGKRLWVLVNHLKSKGYGGTAANNKKRLRQAQRVREIYDGLIAAGETYVAVVGDMNEIPANAPLDPLLRKGSTLRDVCTHAQHQDGGRPGTHGNCTASAKLDYILLSPALFDKVSAAGIERRGMWGGTKGTLWSRFTEVSNADEAASDHAALWVELDI